MTNAQYEELAKIMGMRYREARLKTGMSCSDIAEACGLSANTVANFELGKQGGSLRTIIPMCDAVGIGVGELVDGLGRTISTAKAKSALIQMENIRRNMKRMDEKLRRLESMYGTLDDSGGYSKSSEHQ